MPTDLSDQFVPRIPPWWPPLVPLLRCTPRLLVVTDSLAFDNNTFGLGADISNALDNEHYESFGGDLMARRALGFVSVNW